MEERRPQPLSYASRHPQKRRRVGAALGWMAGAVLMGCFGILALLASVANFFDARPYDRVQRVVWGIVWLVFAAGALLVCVKCVLEARVASGMRPPSGTWWR